MYKFVFFVICAISVNALPTTENAASKEDAKEFVAMNKTTAAAASASIEKLQNMAMGKSMRPSFVAVYPQPFVGSPWKFQRVGMPLVVPRFGTSSLGHRLGGYQQQPAQMYSGYSGYIQPGPAYASPIGYQHQPVIPSTYNYAPYASNSYSSYGYRSAAEDDKLQQQPPSMDQPLQSGVQYETRTYVVRPQDYPADQPQYVEYTASAPSEMQPREVMLMSSPAQNEIDLQRQYDAMMMGYSSSPMNYVAPAMSEPIGTGTDQIYLEEKSPYAKPAPLNQANLQLDDYSSGRYLLPRLTKSYNSPMNWAIQASGPAAPLPTMWT
jgi:hypothetical protein